MPGSRVDAEREKLIQLRKLLIAHFDLEELRLLCFDLGLDYEELAGTTKSTKMQDLITYLRRRGELQRLLDEVNSLRPTVDWPDFSLPSAPEKTERTADIYSDEKSGLEMIRIPAGEFIYGADKRLEYLPEFWISKTPVTNAHYFRFVRETGYDSPEHWGGKSPKAEIADHPVVMVTWHDANACAEWAGMFLPTEEEWEKAARGTDGRIYPWGDCWRDGCCNTWEAGIETTTPVGKYSPQGASPYGCVDMAGNVWEWTASWYDEKEARRVVRGGSWNYYQNLARAAYRNGSLPAFRGYGRGLRLVVHRPPSY